MILYSMVLLAFVASVACTDPLVSLHNKKVSSVFKQTKGKKIGQKRIGDFGGFELTQDVHKLLKNQSGFTQSDVNDAFKQMDYDIEKGSARKIMVRGPRD